MKNWSWLKALKAGPTRRPFRRSKSCGARQKTAAGKLWVENLEARTVPAFLAPVDYAVGQQPLAVVTGDFNGDSIDDLATSNWDANRVSVLLGNPDGSFQAAVHTAGASSLYSLAVGDFNEDSKLDLVGASSNQDGLIVYLGNGNGTFQEPSSNSLGLYTSSVAVGDLNNDGNLDLVATRNDWVIDYWGYYGYYGHYEGTAQVLLGDGGGSFAPSSSTWLGYGYHAGAVAADFNGDGRDDLAAVDGSSFLKVALANSDGSLQAPTDYGTDWSPHSVAMGDLNGDGITDLVTTNSSSVSVFLGNGAAGVGDGTFQDARTASTGYYANSAAAGDFNDDGKLDLAVSVNRWVIDYWGYYGYYGHYERDAQVLLGYGNGHLAEPQTTALGEGWLSGVAAADFNGDGFDDLALPSYYGSAVSVLINDEIWAPLGAPPVSITGASITEEHSGTSDASFTVSIPFAHSEDVTISYATADGSALAGSDYTGGSGDVVIPAGATSVSIPIAIIGDRTGETDEWFAVNITSTDAPVADSQATGWILDDEPRATINDVWITEGNSGSANATFTVTLSEASEEPVTINFSTADGSAAAGSDYQAASGTLTFAAGDTEETITVPVNGDLVFESDEWFRVNLGDAAGAFLADDSGVGSIANDDINLPLISISDVTRVEGRNGVTHFVFTVSLSAPSSTQVKVDYATADGTASAGEDYDRARRTLTFQPGQTTKTISIKVRGDRTLEVDETFSVNLTGVQNGFILDDEGLGTILNDD